MLKEGQMAENQIMSDSIAAKQALRDQYKSSLALYDSLVPGTERWSKVCAQLSHGAEDLNSLWLTDITSTPEGAMNLNGFTTYRSRIPRLSALFDNSLLKEVNVQEIREHTVYKYKIEVPSQSVPQ
jgi:hypothetical protein